MRQAEEQPPRLSQEAVLTVAACPAYQLGLGWCHEPVVKKIITNIPSLPEMLTVTNTQAGKMAQLLKGLLFSQKTRVWFQIPMLGRSQLPVTPAPGDQKPPSGLLGHTHTHT